MFSKTEWQQTNVQFDHFVISHWLRSGLFFKNFFLSIWHIMNLKNIIAKRLGTIFNTNASQLKAKKNTENFNFYRIMNEIKQFLLPLRGCWVKTTKCWGWVNKLTITTVFCPLKSYCDIKVFLNYWWSKCLTHGDG